MASCKFDGCNDVAKARGWCFPHYHLWYRASLDKWCGLDGCGNRAYATGLCRKHYTRKRRHGSPEIVFRKDRLGYLKAAIAGATQEKCLIWPFNKGDRYGIVRYEGRGRPAHRVALHLHTGEPIDTEMFALHGPCNTMRCFNPHHISWGTASDNAVDSYHRDKTGGLPMKLTEESVIAIRSDSRMGIEIAEAYQVSPSLVSRIKSRRIWKHLG